MNLPELLARIEHFLVYQSGLSSTQLAEFRSRSDFESILKPHIDDVFAKINASQQDVENLEQNKNILLGM